MTPAEAEALQAAYAAKRAAWRETIEPLIAKGLKEKARAAEVAAKRIADEGKSE